MSKKRIIKIKTKIKKENNMYPSAELVRDVCAEDYKRLFDTYDKIYDKVNIALVFCSVVLIAIVPIVDYTVIQRIIDNTSKLELLSLVLFLIFSVVSIVTMVWAIIQLLLIMRGKKLYTVDTVAIRNENLYNETVTDASMWLIDKYTICINELKQTIKQKQKSYDSAIVKIIISIIAFVIASIIAKGV